jgi:hypothetical protein
LIPFVLERLFVKLIPSSRYARGLVWLYVIKWKALIGGRGLDKPITIVPSMFTGTRRCEIEDCLQEEESPANQDAVVDYRVKSLNTIGKLIPCSC